MRPLYRSLCGRVRIRTPHHVATRTFATALEHFGQPLHETHPHLLKAGELTPNITSLEYFHRRCKLASSLPPNSIAILAASDIKYRSGAVFYKFHQDPNFLYLTGFNEPEAIAIIEKTGAARAGDGEHNFHLYVRPKNPREEVWEGARSGIEAASEVFNADEAGELEQVRRVLPDLVAGRDVYTDIPVEAQPRSDFTRMVFGAPSNRSGIVGELLQGVKVKPLKGFMNNLRVIKSDAEVENMRKAGKASGRAFTEAMRQQWKTERDLETFLNYKFKANGCEEAAYVPVVAGGENAIMIHYVRNDAALSPNELVTVDAGGEYGGYVTDITRSWPVNGKFTEPQKDLYSMILGVQRRCVALCKQSQEISLDGLHSVAEQGLREGLKDLGFDVKHNALETLFPHHVGHYVGLAVHDAPGHTRNEMLKKGHCITIEPGVYVDQSERWPEHFRGIGIRIEDSVCVQEEGPLVLTTEAVKEVVDIEALRG